ncbi:MAG: fatty acid desaturase family protein [Myxococcota bacterium]|nr:fatty acid desaturase family protein [Myxococcota bacterium]
MKLSDFASREELAPFIQRDNRLGAAYVVFNWVAIAAIFAGVALWTNPLTILIGLALLGGRQLACAALMHDCGHRLLFSSRQTNAWVGQWLCAYPVFSDVHRYAAGHLKHHALAGTDKDPDLSNYQAYPVTRASFRRKIARDLTGRTGWRSLQATWRRGRDQILQAPWNGNALLGHLIVQVILFAILLAFGHPWLYWMWPVAYLTTYMLIARLRQVAEHGAVPDLYDRDPRRNTRTTLVRWWERPFVAPFQLNYHLEHHIHANVPCYHLRSFHQFLSGRGLYEGVEFPRSYRELYARMIR